MQWTLVNDSPELILRRKMWGARMEKATSGRVSLLSETWCYPEDGENPPWHTNLALSGEVLDGLGDVYALLSSVQVPSEGAAREKARNLRKQLAVLARRNLNAAPSSKEIKRAFQIGKEDWGEPVVGFLKWNLTDMALPEGVFGEHGFLTSFERERGGVVWGLWLTVPHADKEGYRKKLVVGSGFTDTPKEAEEACYRAWRNFMTACEALP
jgi:hypothetical protein